MPAVERAHADHHEGGRLDARVSEQERGAVTEGGAEQAADGERGREVAGAAAGADGERGRDHLGRREREQEAHQRPSAGQPGAPAMAACTAP